MNKRCARCQRTVYPVEELKCLDKSWHKGCFNCEECGMTLNMKNYKGYNKLPYCHAHYPTTKFTTVADTPESRRLAKNTLNQSQINYQKKFVEEKGQKISVADDPETMRAKRNTQNQSAVAYTGHLQQRDISELHRPAEDPKGAYPQQKTSVGSLFMSPDVPMAAHQQAPPQHQGGRVGGAGGGRYRAIYDYQAADHDEVDLQEGDIIVNGASIDEGWMTGTVQRTGKTGMLPSNYVEPF